MDLIEQQKTFKTKIKAAKKRRQKRQHERKKKSATAAALQQQQQKEERKKIKKNATNTNTMNNNCDFCQKNVISWHRISLVAHTPLLARAFTRPAFKTARS